MFSVASPSTQPQQKNRSNNGSTYTLIYDPLNDVLKGVYFQAVLQQKFDVYFTVEVQRLRLARNVYRVKREGAETFQRCVGRAASHGPQFQVLPSAPDPRGLKLSVYRRAISNSVNGEPQSSRLLSMR